MSIFSGVSYCRWRAIVRYMVRIMGDGLRLIWDLNSSRSNERCISTGSASGACSGSIKGGSRRSGCNRLEHSPSHVDVELQRPFLLGIFLHLKKSHTNHHHPEITPIILTYVVIKRTPIEFQSKLLRLTLLVNSHDRIGQVSSTFFKRCIYLLCSAAHSPNCPRVKF